MFESYQERDRAQLQRNLVIGGITAVGLGVLFTRGRQALGSGIVRAASFLERKLEQSAIGYGGALDFERKTDFENLVYKFGRFRAFDLNRQAARTRAVEALVNPQTKVAPGLAIRGGWTREEAEKLFAHSLHSIDLLGSGDVPSTLAQSFYLKRLPGRMNYSDIVHDVDIAVLRGGFKADEALVSEELHRRSSVGFAQHLIDISKRTTTPGIFGLEEVPITRARDNTGRRLVRPGFLDFIDKPYRYISTGHAARQAEFIQEVMRRGNIQDPTGLESSIARAAFYLHEAGVRNPSELLRNIPSGIFSAGGRTTKFDRLFSFLRNFESKLSENWQIPIVPGGFGIQPFRMFPWNRAKVELPFLTLPAGTAQRELMGWFPTSPEGVVDRDIYSVGGHLFSTNEGGGIVEPTKDYRWQFRDARHGFWSEFSRIRNRTREDRTGRFYRAGRFRGALDLLGLDKQGDPSNFSKKLSVLERNIYPDRYPDFPTQLLSGRGGVLAGNLSAVEPLLEAIGRQANVDPEFFGDILRRALDRQRGLPQTLSNLRRILQVEHDPHSLSIAMREIDQASARVITTGNFFTGSDRFLLDKTRAFARRFAENDILALSESYTGGLESVSPIGGFIGSRNSISGFDRIRQLLHEETIAQITRLPGEEGILQGMISDIRGMNDLSSRQKEDSITALWSHFRNPWLRKDLELLDLTRPGNRAEIVAYDLVGDPQLLKEIKGSLGRYYSPTTWIGEQHEGFSYYAIPNRKELGLPGLLTAGVESLHSGSIDPLKDLWGDVTGKWGQSMAPGAIYHGAFRMNRLLSEVGLGLPDSALETTASIATNLFAKRVIPVVLGIEYWKWANHELHQLGLPGGDDVLANSRANITLGAARLADILGLTPRLKRLQELSPGTEDYFNMRTADEERAYLDRGFTPIRKGRGWVLGSRTPLVGDRIEYFSPSWYRMAKSHWQEAQNVDLNTEDYQAHSLIPTPTHPFSFIKHFTQPYWFETKHSIGDNADRPYLISGSMFEQNTIWGSILNPTIGAILKPKKILHPEYLPENLEETLSREPQEDSSDGNNFYIAWTGSGKGSVFHQTGVDKSTQLHGSISRQVLLEVNEKLRDESSGRTISGLSVAARSPAGHSDIFEGQPPKSLGFVPTRIATDSVDIDLENIISPGPETSLRNLIQQRQHIYGIYGFMEQSTVGWLGQGLGKQDILRGQIADPSIAYGWERRAYDVEAGGLGGPISEFWRRVLPHRDRNLAYFDPVLNQMPDWLPGGDYMTDFHRGDPYVQIRRGEIRLPGEAYNRVHGIKGELSDIDKLEVLGDSSPWSSQYKNQLGLVRARERTDEEQERINAITARVAAQKKLLNIRDKRFQGDTRTGTFTISHLIDANTFAIEGSDHPLRLAGVRAASTRVSEKALRDLNIQVQKGESPIAALYRAFGIVPGARVQASYNLENPYSDDLLETRRATIYMNGININRALVQLGVAEEKETEWTPAAIEGRFTPLERMYGRVWEWLSHQDTFLNSKFLQVRSALEHYKREQVYGSNAGTWTSPISTWLQPTMEAITSRNLLFAPITGAFVGSLFGKTQWAKGVGALVGGGLGFLLSSGRMSSELIHHEAWIPDRVKKRREIEEYIDTLEYVKYRRLYAQESELAQSEEGVDVEDLARKMRERGDKLSEKIDRLVRRKRAIYNNIEDPDIRKRQLRNINKQINDLGGGFSESVGPHTARALMFREESHTTLQGFQPGDPFPNLLAALPRYEREIVADIIDKGTNREKKEFYRLLPDNEKVVLGTYLGGKVVKKKNLEEYFRNHTLPDANWKGFEESFPLEAVRDIAAEEEGVNLQEMYLYPRNIQEARILTREVQVPTVFGHTDDIRKTLETLLSGAGVKDIRVDLEVSPSQDRNRFNAEVDFHHDRTDNYISRI